MIEIAVCDDDQTMQERCARELRMAARAMRVEVQIHCYADSFELSRDLQMGIRKVQILYLDMHMPERDGITVAQELRQNGYKGEIIFWTVSRAEVLQAFDVAAFHYLVKSLYSKERFQEIFSRAVLAVQEKEKRYIHLARGVQSRRIEVSQIDYFVVEDRIITVVYGEEEFSFYSTIGKLELRLAQDDFVRVNRSYLVNLSAIEGLNAKEVILNSGVRIAVSNARAKELRRLLDRERYLEDIQGVAFSQNYEKKEAQT
ncbi:MAG: LytTR family DNA-binding domain-containing protein [Hespellia sp.]|nr:LytTR family DNA-binding domain-containing protein [Hespellia sp.]